MGIDEHMCADRHAAHWSKLAVTGFGILIRVLTIFMNENSQYI